MKKRKRTKKRGRGKGRELSLLKRQKVRVDSLVMMHTSAHSIAYYQQKCMFFSPFSTLCCSMPLVAYCSLFMIVIFHVPHLIMHIFHVL